MSKPIRPYKVGDEVIMVTTAVHNYSCFIEGDVGTIVYLNESGKHVDVRVRGEQQQIDMVDIAHHNSGYGELFDGLTYG